MTTRLSSLQYPMLKMFAGDNPGDYMSVEIAQRFDQRPFRSMLYRGWIRYVKNRGFHITREGKDAWYEFEHHSIARKNPALPLTSYFDPDAYGITLRKRQDRTGVDRVKSAQEGAAA